MAKKIGEAVTVFLTLVLIGLFQCYYYDQCGYEPYDRQEASCYDCAGTIHHHQQDAGDDCIMDQYHPEDNAQGK